MKLIYCMEFEHPIFEKICETPSGELTEETIQEWIDVSKEFQNEHTGSYIGLHVSSCESATESCCQMCNTGHTIVTGVQEREDQNITNMVSCTTEGCNGPFL